MSGFPLWPATDLLMERAIRRAAHSRLLAPPNPWVGAVLVAVDGTSFEGSTRRPGGHHAEIEVLLRAGNRARGGVLAVTLEPCSHHGRTPPCVDAIVRSGVAKVVVGVLDPDERVAGRGVAALRDAGLEVEVGAGADSIEAQLAPYLHHRRTGRPLVVLKLASTIDGRVAAPDGSSQWITSVEAREDVHRLRAESDAILVGAGTVRDDDPRLTVRGVLASDGGEVRQPLRVVLGTAPSDAAVHPCLERGGDLESILDELGGRGILQVMIEGGAGVAGDFHRSGLVDRYVIYVAPAFMGGSDGRPMLSGQGPSTLAGIWRGRYANVQQFGPDLRLDVIPNS